MDLSFINISPQIIFKNDTFNLLFGKPVRDNFKKPFTIIIERDKLEELLFLLDSYLSTVINHVSLIDWKNQNKTYVDLLGKKQWDRYPYQADEELKRFSGYLQDNIDNLINFFLINNKFGGRGGGTALAQLNSRLSDIGKANRIGAMLPQLPVNQPVNQQREEVLLVPMKT